MHTYKMFKHCNLKCLNDGRDYVYTKLKQLFQFSHKAGLQELAQKGKQQIPFLLQEGYLGPRLIQNMSSCSQERSVCGRPEEQIDEEQHATL